MKIHLGSDHAGFELKEKLKVFLRELGHQVSDEGAYSLNEGDDYPDVVKLVAKLVQADDEARGIVLGGSGQGEAVCANRLKKIRAALYYGGPLEIVKLSREHNNSNILSLGARFISEEEARAAVKMWLDTPFSGEDRHIRRIFKIDNDEQTLVSF